MIRQPLSLQARLTRARLAMLDGRRDEGIEELRCAILDAARLSPAEGRRHVQEVLDFARDHDVFSEVEETFESGSLRRHFFGRE